MRSIVIIVFSALMFFSCNDNGKKPVPGKLPVSTQPLAKANVTDSSQLFMDSTKEILKVIKTRDYKSFAHYIHPVLGIRFSPYGYIDTAKDVTFSADQFIHEYQKGYKINWGNYDGSGAKILLSIEEYFKKFVYNVDFVNAEKTNFDKITGKGNSLNNLKKVYKQDHFTESYFSGFDKKYNGMDWTSLKLVFKNYGNRIYLVAIIHDQWTI